MKNKNKLPIIALILAWAMVTLFSLLILNPDAFTGDSLLYILCPVKTTTGPTTLEYVHSNCIWKFILTIPFFTPLLLFITVMILGFLSLKSEKKVVALLAIGIVTSTLLFYLPMLWDLIHWRVILY